MQWLYLGMQVFSAYGAIILSFILLFGAAILFFRTKTTHTGMIFFGLLLSKLLPLLMSATSKIGMSPFMYSVLALLAALSIFISAVGFLLYAKSLPKLSAT